jgi:hypothetical protein
MDIGGFWLILATCTIVTLVFLPRRVGLYPQCLVIAVAIVVLLMFQECLGEEYDPGGSPALAMAQVSKARRLGTAVAIRGICNSSCALKLAAGRNLCVSPASKIGVHEVRKVSRPGDYPGGVRDNLWTGFFEGMLPACARDLFNARHGFDSGRLAVISGADVLRACPTIQACPPL